MTGDPVEANRWRAVRIAARVSGRFHFVGSGFVLVRIGKAYVVTNTHLVSKARANWGEGVELWADFSSPVNAHPLQVLGHDSAADVVVLGSDVEIEDGQEKTAEPNEGHVIFRIGYSDLQTGKEAAIAAGTIALVAPYAPDLGALITSGVYPGMTVGAFVITGLECPEGSSGSPLFDKNGRLVGYLKGRLDRLPLPGCLAFTIKHALDLLEQLDH